MPASIPTKAASTSPKTIYPERQTAAEGGVASRLQAVAEEPDFPTAGRGESEGIG
jgi:hypothetical protein